MRVTLPNSVSTRQTDKPKFENRKTISYSLVEVRMKTIWHFLKIRMATVRRYLCAYMSKIPLRRRATVVVVLSLWMACGGICGSQGLPHALPESPVPSFGEIHWYVSPAEKAPLPSAEVLLNDHAGISE